jgi:hypothetical protein
MRDLLLTEALQFAQFRYRSMCVVPQLCASDNRRGVSFRAVGISIRPMKFVPASDCRALTCIMG